MKRKSLGYNYLIHINKKQMIDLDNDEYDCIYRIAVYSILLLFYRKK